MTLSSAQTLQIPAEQHQGGVKGLNNCYWEADILVTLPVVRHLRYLPFAFLVGQEGFVLFLPYLVLCMALHLILRPLLAGRH